MSIEKLIEIILEQKKMRAGNYFWICFISYNLYLGGDSKILAKM